MTPQAVSIPIRSVAVATCTAVPAAGNTVSGRRLRSKEGRR